ncbi:RES family NAD+ phosphorylase [Mucilaginibacter sabulilitoris]|uniref:RES family NAD+ phosphorylase n=1 Tax=Mucilaginibacter sabulilitoris TaxID=1173583 RepID=A0ABZ0TRR3_9SPHI|nr:RES family NAD+ phosphorylase [Mucilaginibacter sabulilitoris]WPU95592.1 RES family NAD+ phosphorylase [Mucilaginibacter sabulilitoris]
MILYRIARERYARDLSGRGGLLSAARWHNHMPVRYSSLQSSACILEKLVHLELGEIHHDLQMVVMSAPDDASRLTLDRHDLPADWDRYPAPQLLQRIGNAWLTSGQSLLLEIPCALDPYAQNV